ncbi:uncharacterized protein LOC122638947 [Telopea speciosissima]|uniref:uncharacterized protein LOC122638947 n=1 Tax=Telopea speciosissima TaxID=54955 RepID=UPI001CC4C6B6|nr:uncharacterized protein LOC122638947 [Telopea speciosissima]
MADATDEVFVEDDDTLLSLVEKAESDALSRKRKKMEGQPSLQQLSTTSTPLCSISQGTENPSIAGNVVPTGGAAGGSGSGSGPCFKCGKLGHWARDCDALDGGGGCGSVGGAERENSDPSVVEKPCACGLGTCLVLTANTEKNRGRKFYKCPVREENGGCGFFEWCDNSLKTSVSNGAQIKPTNSSFPNLQCPCGAGRCLILTVKTEKHPGKQFYRCPFNQVCCVYMCVCMLSCKDDKMRFMYITADGKQNIVKYGDREGSGVKGWGLAWKESAGVAEKGGGQRKWRVLELQRRAVEATGYWSCGWNICVKEMDSSGDRERKGDGGDERF